MASDSGAPEEVEKEPEGPAAQFKIFLDCEKMIDRLKLLDYDANFCAKLKLKPFSRHYFAIPTNAGEQFPHFSSLAAFLIQQAGRDNFEQPQEFDDPNSTVANILSEVKNLASSEQLNFPPMRLKDGSGPYVVQVLSILTDCAVKQQKQDQFRPPQYPEEVTDQNEIIEDDDTELTWQKPSGDDEEDDIEGEIAFEDDGNLLLDLNAATPNIQSGTDGPFNQQPESTKIEAVLQSDTDASEWKLEVERVQPHLKVVLKSDNKDWRAHHDQLAQAKNQVKDSVKASEVDLNRLHAEASKTLEKIASREKYISAQLDAQLQTYREAQNRLAHEKEKYRHASGGITEKQKFLNLITDELEKIKREMEDRGSSMTDAKPLKRIRDSLTKIKKEIVHIDIRTGVVEHSLIQAKLNAKRDVGASVRSSGGATDPDDDLDDLDNNEERIFTV